MINKINKDKYLVDVGGAGRGVDGGGLVGGSGGIVGLTRVRDIGDVSAVGIGDGVGDGLDPAVGEVDGVGAGGGVAVPVLTSVEPIQNCKCEMMFADNYLR